MRSLRTSSETCSSSTRVSYREAATHALDQLEWCIDYVHRVRKPDIARAIARNRTQILERLGSAGVGRVRGVSGSLWRTG
jgi:hypothetical protein